jgi:hypothetical protein
MMQKNLPLPDGTMHAAAISASESSDHFGICKRLQVPQAPAVVQHLATMVGCRQPGDGALSVASSCGCRTAC